MQYSSEHLLNELVISLANQPLCASREEAYEAILKSWLHINERNGSPVNQIQHILARRMCTEHGWENLHADPCYVDSFIAPAVRVNLHHNGTIVIQRMDCQPPQVLSVLLGKIKKIDSNRASDGSAQRPRQ